MAKQITIINPTDDIETAYVYGGMYPYISTYGKDDEGNFYRCYWFIPHASVIAYELMEDWVTWDTPHGWELLDLNMDEDEYNDTLEYKGMGESEVWLKDENEIYNSVLNSERVVQALDEYDEAKEKAESED